MLAHPRRESPLTSPRAALGHSWSTAEAALEREAEVIVRSTDAQLASLRDAALSLSVGRRRDRCARRATTARARTPAARVGVPNAAAK